MNFRAEIIIYLILSLSISSSAQSETETRNFIKSVPVGKESSLEITNKYGTIQVTSWNKDSAYIRAEVKGIATNQAKLKKMFDGISVTITETNYLIRAQTDFSQNIGMFFENFKGMTGNIITYGSRIEINYFISIPEYLNLKIENKYGDVYMENTTGNLSLTVSNGSFRANSLGKASNLTLAFCNAKINSIESGEIDATFSEISISKTGYLKLNSTSSRYDVKDSKKILLESRRDKIFIDDIGTLLGNSYFTDFNIANLTEELSLTTRYGNVNTDFIQKGFRTIDINSAYTDLSLRFDNNSSYNLDIRRLNAFLVLPDNSIKTEEKIISEDKKEYITFGTYGPDPVISKVKIDATRGNIYLK
jgi:hypothetical protein